MATPAGTFFDKNSRTFEEVISKDFMVFQPTLDPIWENVLTSNQGVTPPSLLGRGWEIYKVLMGGYTGVIDGAQSTGEFGLYGDQSYSTEVNTNKGELLAGRSYRQRIQNSFPDPEDGAMINQSVLKVPLRGFHTNLLLTMAMLRAEATPAFIQEVITPYMRSFAQNLAHVTCNYAYLSQNSSYALCSMTNVTVTALAGTITFSPNNYAIDRFWRGMRVDIYSASSGVAVNRKNDTASLAASQTPETRIPLYVTNVDEATNLVTLKAVAAANGEVSDPTGWTGAAGADPANGDLILHANSRGSSGFTGIAGLHSWAKFGTGTNPSDTAANNPDNYLLGAEATGSVNDGQINVNTHTECKSVLKAINGYLTEHQLRKCLHMFDSAKGRYGQYLDTLIASDGVWLGYQSQKIGSEMLDRTGRLGSLNNEGSQTGGSFTYNGRTYQMRTSRYIESGVLWGLRVKNNWSRIVPPDPKGASSNGDVPGSIPFKFLAPVLGGGSITRLPILRTVGSAPANARYTEASCMPGACYMQLMPTKQFSAMKLTGITEDRLLSDTTYS
jgi:hypothetical protein